jgi:hypothetical protein
MFVVQARANCTQSSCDGVRVQILTQPGWVGPEGLDL